MKNILTVIAGAPNLFLRTQHVVFGGSPQSPIVRDSVGKKYFRGTAAFVFSL
jgi:hypothetical protein